MDNSKKNNKPKKTWSKPELKVLSISKDTHNGMGMGAEALVMGMLSNGS